MLSIFPLCIRTKIQNCIYGFVLKRIFDNFFFAIIKRRSSLYSVEKYLSWELSGIIALIDQIKNSEDSEPFYLGFFFFFFCSISCSLTVLTCYVDSAVNLFPQLPGFSLTIRLPLKHVPSK